MTDDLKMWEDAFPKVLPDTDVSQLKFTGTTGLSIFSQDPAFPVNPPESEYDFFPDQSI